MRLASNFLRYLAIGFVICLSSNLQGQDLCSVTSTCGPDWICLDETETIMTCYECGEWSAAGAVYEWIIEKCDYDPATGTVCNTSTIVNTSPIFTAVPALSYTFSDVGVFRFKVIVRDAATGVAIAVPCTGGSLCQTAEVWVYGLPDPSFTNVTPLSCTYDPATDTYNHLVQIDPHFNQQATSGGTSTFIDVDWGDGNTSQHFLTPGQPTNVTHAYSWPATAAPNFPITVNASRSSPWPSPINCVAFSSFTGAYQPVLSTPDISFIIQETDCHNQTICISGADDYDLIEVFDEDNQLIHSLVPGDTPCVNFQANGSYRFLVYDGTGNCPQVVTYNVLLAPNTTGALSSPDSYVRPGDPFTLNLTNPGNHFVTYEILEHRPSGPFWLLFYYGPAAQMNNFSVPDYITQQFTPAMLNSDFEFCFRASVLCDEGDIAAQDPNAGTFSNVICLPVCAAPDDTGGGGGDHPGMSLSDGNDEASGLALFSGSATNQFLIYPNPASGPFTVEWDALPAKDSGSLEARNLLGQVVWQQELAAEAVGGGSLSIDLSNSLPGQYALIWTTSEQRIVVGQLVVVP